MANYITTFGEIRGSVGGVTFFRNRGGICMRMRAAPIQPDTPAQSLQRNILAGLSTDWGESISQAQRNAWSFFANQHPTPNKVGQMIKLSGQQMYIKINGRLLTAGLAQLDDPPVNLQVRAVASGDLTTATAGLAVVDVDVLPVMTITEYVYIFLAANVPPGVNNAENQKVFVGAIQGDGIATTHVVGVPPKFGALIAGTYVHASVHRLNETNGALTPAYNSKLIVT